MLGFEVHGYSTALEIGEEDVVVGVRLQIRYEVTSTPNGFIVAQRLTAELPSGISGSVLSYFLRRRLRRLQRDTLERLAGYSETGASV